MKHAVLILITISIFVTFIAVVSADCSSYPNENSCKTNSCFWCNRCAGNSFNLINNYGADKCVSSNLNCTYSCSKLCGSDCSANVDCQNNLSDTDCFYAGACSACKCLYQRSSCPRPGTIQNNAVTDGNAVIRTCYYGNRQCSSTGCVINTCTLGANSLCHPDDGCITPSQESKCVGDDIYTKKQLYSCNATFCSFTKSDFTFTEKCATGCTEGKCNEQPCGYNGIQLNCSTLNGYYSRYCIGNDVYVEKRDYKCTSDKCEYASSSVKQTTCRECYKGQCVQPSQIILISPQEPTLRQEINNITYTTNRTYAGGRLYNGLLFGSNEINIDVQGTGRINFSIARTNSMGELVIQSGRVIFKGKAGPGDYSIPFSNSTRIKFYTTSSGWLLFAPAVYDIGLIMASY